MESGDVLRVTHVLWVAKHRRSVMSVSVIEKKGFDIVFQDGHALIKPRGSISKTTNVLGVRERNLYRLKGQPMQAMAHSKVAMNKEQVDPKVVQTQRESNFRGSQQAQRESASSKGESMV
jgi:hypothetical protein